MAKCVKGWVNKFDPTSFIMFTQMYHKMLSSFQVYLIILRWFIVVYFSYGSSNCLVGLTAFIYPTDSISWFAPYSKLSKHNSSIQILRLMSRVVTVLLWQNCHIWIWLEDSYTYCKIKNVSNGDINEKNLYDPSRSIILEGPMLWIILVFYWSSIDSFQRNW